jgi:hypothetical protein
LPDKKAPQERIEYALMVLGQVGPLDVAEDALAALDELVPTFAPPDGYVIEKTEPPECGFWLIHPDGETRTWHGTDVAAILFARGIERGAYSGD